MLIKIFGPGCAKCEEAKKLAEKVVQENTITATIEKVTDLKEMMHLGIMSTPAIAIDGVVKCTGRVPSASEMLGWITNPDAASAPAAPTASAGGCCCGGKC